jgi:hypothetical protein
MLGPIVSLALSVEIVRAAVGETSFSLVSNIVGHAMNATIPFSGCFQLYSAW